MQGYRQPPEAVPLLAWIGGRLVAMDPATGALRWEKQLPIPPDRILVAGKNVFLSSYTNAADSTLHFLDLATGAERGALLVGYPVTAAMAVGDLLYFSGGGGMIALTTEGVIQFRVSTVVTKKSAWDGDKHDLVATNAFGSEIWRIHDTSIGRLASLLAFGEHVAQADIDT